MLSPATVLIVEDNYLLLEMLTRMCEREGMRVLAASSGEAALTMLRAEGEGIGWLFTDINLPGLFRGGRCQGECRAGKQRKTGHAPEQERCARMRAFKRHGLDLLF